MTVRAPGRSRCLPVPSTLLSATILGARKAATSPMGTLMKKTDLHPKAAVSAPPRTTPAANPADDTAAKTLRARVLSGPSGKLICRRESAVDEAMAAPTPWTALETRRTTSEGASPPEREERAKIKSPMLKTLRRP